MSRRKPELLDALFAVTREAKTRREALAGEDKALVLYGLLMASQRTLDADPARLIAVLSARRTGKSTGVLLIVCRRCLGPVAQNWVVIGLTRPSVKRIYWASLKALSKAYELGIKFQHQELIATFPNGSTISFVGAENAGEIEKLRGGKYDGAVVDECKSYAAHVFTELVHDVLEPALLDLNGQLFLIGTPGDILDGPFYLATCSPPVLLGEPPEPGTPDNRPWSNWAHDGTPTDGRGRVWSLHAWTLRDNTTKFRDPLSGRDFTLWDAALERKKRNGWSDTHPTWQREYLGRWIANLSKKVYRYYSHAHDYTPDPEHPWGLPRRAITDDVKWRTAIGIDFGTRDGTAMVVWAWSPHSRDLWEVYSERRTSEAGQRLSVSQIAEWYRDLDSVFGPFDGTAADPAGLATMVMDTLAVDHAIYIEPAEKTEKPDHIEIFNTDLDAGLIHVRRGGQLAEELSENRWDRAKWAKGRRVEDPAVPNDTADAGLYSFRWCDHRRSKPPEARPVTPMFPTAETLNAMAARELAEAVAAAEARNRADLDREWWS